MKNEVKIHRSKAKKVSVTNVGSIPSSALTLKTVPKRLFFLF